MLTITQRTHENGRRPAGGCRSRYRTPKGSSNRDSRGGMRAVHRRILGAQLKMTEEQRQRAEQRHQHPEQRPEDHYPRAAGWSAASKAGGQPVHGGRFRRKAATSTLLWIMAAQHQHQAATQGDTEGDQEDFHLRVLPQPGKARHRDASAPPSEESECHSCCATTLADAAGYRSQKARGLATSGQVQQSPTAQECRTCYSHQAPRR